VALRRVWSTCALAQDRRDRPTRERTNEVRTMKSLSFENARSAEAYQISLTDTNYFAILFDPKKDTTDAIFVVEIFNVGGATPPNTHSRAHEFFYVLHGEGMASSDGEERPIVKGDALLLDPGGVHVVRNTGTTKLYTLTVMVPNQEFSELIRSGRRVELDEEDIRVLQGH
jgi:mannose-6-phosphate isomerase-like protein (cupin superfamily)